MIKVKDEPDLMRDNKGVIQNVNTNAYREYIHKRDIIIKDRERISALEKDTREIKDSLAQIIKLLKGE